MSNVWLFPDGDTHARVVGGIPGPSPNPVGDSKAFDDALALLDVQENYIDTLGKLDEIVYRAYQQAFR